jgi:hypothetical protein
LLNTTFSRVTFEDIDEIDALTLVKLVQSYQLTIEYLLYSQDFYRAQINDLENKVREINARVINLVKVVFGK